MPHRPHPGLGIALILASGLLLSSQDALSKTLTAVYPVLLVMWLRYLSQNLLMLALFAPSMGWNLVRTRRPWLQLARGFSLVAITLLFYSALRYIPLGEATAVIFLAPLVVIVLSATVLKEHISREPVAVGGLWPAGRTVDRAAGRGAVYPGHSAAAGRGLLFRPVPAADPSAQWHRPSGHQ